MRTVIVWSGKADITYRYDILLEVEAKERNVTYVKELLYPPETTGNLSATLPLEHYVGSYYHPGYGCWYITFVDGILRNDMDRGPVLHYDAELIHITADHFLIVGYEKDAPEDPWYIQAEFKVGMSGEVDWLGCTLTDEMGDDKIWFSKDNVVDPKGAPSIDGSSNARRNLGPEMSNAGLSKPHHALLGSRRSKNDITKLVRKAV